MHNAQKFLQMILQAHDGLLFPAMFHSSEHSQIHKEEKEWTHKQWDYHPHHKVILPKYLSSDCWGEIHQFQVLQECPK